MKSREDANTQRRASKKGDEYNSRAARADRYRLQQQRQSYREREQYEDDDIDTDFELS